MTITFTNQAHKRFAGIIRQIDARRNDPDVDKNELKEIVGKIETEILRRDEANSAKIERFMKFLESLAEDVYVTTSSTLADLEEDVHMPDLATNTALSSTDAYLSSDQGLLDLAVELSTSDVSAGNEFAIFVLVKNPFRRPVWIQEVNVSLPSELKRVDEEKTLEKLKEAEDKQHEELERAQLERRELSTNIDKLKDQVSELTKAFSSNEQGVEEETSERVRSLQIRLERDLDEFQGKLKRPNVGSSNLQLFGAVEIDKIRIESLVSNVEIYGDKAEDPKVSRIKQIEIYEPWLAYEQQARARTIKLKSSLPDGAALQPGSTAVYTVVLNVKRSLIFTPAKYRLQFYVNYRFQPPPSENQSSAEGVFTNTISHSLSIRPSVYSMIIGSAIGGAVGAAGRLLQSPSPTTQSVIVSLLLSVILGGMAVIFMARKSDTQSFVSVEDFWGGVLIGFLVGYSGTSFFESITGMPSPKL